MASRAAKFISAIFASVIAGAPLTTVSQGANAAADDCLSGPKGATPQGQHWYYRLERGTKRQCWYLREEGAAATPSAATTGNPVTQNSDATPSRSVQDAHAEMPQPAADQDAAASLPPAPPPAAPPAPARVGVAATDDSTQQQPAVASRWPDVSATSPAVSAPAAPTVAVTNTRQKLQAAPSPAASPVTLAAADVPPAKPTGSIPTLLLVVLGALAIAGLSGSIIYRFAGSRDPFRNRAGQRRRVNWEPAVDGGRAPWADEVQSFEVQSFAPRTEFAPAPDPAPEPDHTAAAEPVPEPEQAASEPDVDAIDIDQITEMLERLAKEGPKLSRPSATGSATYAQSPQDRSGVRA